VDRNLLSGLTISLVAHAVMAWWIVGLQMRPRPPVEPDKKVVRTVQEVVELPKPKPKPPEPPKEEPKEQPKQEVAKADAPAPQPKPVAHRPPQPKSLEPKQDAPKPNNEPAPLVLSKTYGSGGDEGVAVQSGKDDVLGDPGVEANAENVRRRPTSEPIDNSGKGGDGADKGVEPAKVEILLAKPKIANCEGFVTWPEGAPSSNRIVRVVLLLDIGADGLVKKTRILKGAGQPFDDEAQRGIRRCPFQPGTRDGKPISTKVGFEVEFKPTS
jgi:TonB family protein